MRGRFLTSYLPSLNWYLAAAECASIYLDHQVRWQKQCLMNRCFILGPNGVQCLSVPLQSTGGKTLLCRDMKISYAGDWIRQHQKSLEAAYNRSPWFDQVRDALWELYSTRPIFLIDLNYPIIEVLHSAFRLPKPQVLEGEDLRLLTDFSALSLRKGPGSSSLSYPQVFSDRFGFVDDLSVIDCLSNRGYLLS